MQLPVPAWLPRRFLHHHQKWPRTSPYPSSTSRRYARLPPAMELDLDLVQYACCEYDWNKTEAYGAFASSWVKHRWIFCVLRFGSMNEQNLSLGDLHVVRQRWKWRMRASIFMLMLLSAQLPGPTMPLVSDCDELSCVFVSTVYNMQSVWGSRRGRSFISLVFILNSASPSRSFFKTPILLLNPRWASQALILHHW